jgi:hypothetical protein
LGQPVVGAGTAGIGAQQKLMFEDGCFRFCPFSVIA